MPTALPRLIDHRRSEYESNDIRSSSLRFRFLALCTNDPRDSYADQVETDQHFRAKSESIFKSRHEHQVSRTESAKEGNHVRGERYSGFDPARSALRMRRHVL